MTLPVVTALARADGRRPELEALLGRMLGEQDVLDAARLIEESGARDEAMDIAETHLDAALASLDRADLLSGPRSQLEAIAHFVTVRDR